MIIHYQILGDHELLVQKCIGDFSVEHFTSYLKELVQHKDWDLVTKLVVDYRECNLEPAIEDTEKVAKIRKQILIKDIFMVLLVNSPVNTAAIHLYKEDLNYESGSYFCSTTDHALKLLRIDHSEKELEDLFTQLENSI